MICRKKGGPDTARFENLGDGCIMNLQAPGFRKCRGDLTGREVGVLAFEVDDLIFFFLGQPLGMRMYRMRLVCEGFDTAFSKSLENPVDGRKRNIRFLMNLFRRLFLIEDRTD